MKPKNVLQRVAEALGPDAGAMVDGWVRSFVYLFSSLPQLLVRALNEVGGSGKHGNPTGNGSLEGPPLEHPHQHTHQPLIPRRIERLQELTPCPLSAAGQERLDVFQRVSILPIGSSTPLPDRLDLDVEVPNVAEGSTDPLELLPQTSRPSRKRLDEKTQRRPEPPGRHAHVVELFRVFPQPGSSLLGQEDVKLAAKYSEGDLADGHRALDNRRPEVRSRRSRSTQDDEARLELGHLGLQKAAGMPEFLDEGSQRRAVRVMDLHLDTLEPNRLAPVADRDSRPIQSDLAGRAAVEQEREGPPHGPDLEQVGEGVFPRDQPDTSSDRTLALEKSFEVRLRERLRDLSSPPDSSNRRRHRLEGRFGRPAATTHPQGEARTVEAPVGRIDIRVDQPARRHRDDVDPMTDQIRRCVRHGRGPSTPRVQPPLDRSKIDSVELPLDLLVVVWGRPGPLLFARCGHGRADGAGGRESTSRKDIDQAASVRVVHLSFIFISGKRASGLGAKCGHEGRVTRCLPPGQACQGRRGIVWRQGERAVEVAVVHRPAYDDWTFPKGKLVPGEEEDVGALSEVEEETGLRCKLERFVGSTRYG